MSTYPAHGSSGSVDSGSTAVGSVTNWTYDSSVDVQEVVVMGATAAEYPVSSVVKGGGSLDMVWDQDDAGQVTLTCGATIVLHLMFDGETATDDELTGSVQVETLNWAVPVEGVQTASLTYKGVLILGVVGS